MIDAATMICPMSRRAKFNSRTTAATILIEEIDKATPRKRAVARRWSEFGMTAAGAAKPSAIPQRKGTRIPASEALSAGDPILRKSRMSTSMPVSASNRRTPTSANAPSTAFCEGSIGKTACCAAGQTRPKNEGPSRIPAMSWPITAGWPRRWAASPSRREASRMTTIGARKAASESIEVAG